jgi:hypothetical protein
MLLVLIPVSLAAPFRCHHDDFIKALNVTFPKRLQSVPKALWTDPSTGSPIRILFDTSPFDRPDTSKICTSAGSRVSWTLGTSRYSVVCTEDDILTATRKAVLKQTIPNVDAFLTRLLKVVPIRGYFNLDSYTDLPVTTS